MKKYFKYIVAVILVLISIFMAKAASITGNGCLVGSVYTQYLGIGYPYGPGQGYRVYKSNGPSIAINYNNYNSSKPNNYNYVCGQINIFGSGTGPAQDEFVETSQPCIISPSVNSSNVDGYGSYGSYNYNKDAYCSTSSVPVPLDGYTWVIVLGIGATGVFFISRKTIIA